MVQQANDQAAKIGIPQAIPAFVDAGEPIRQAAQDSLDGARRELNGETVKINPRDGEPYDHVKKVRQAQWGLAKLIRSLQSKIGNPFIDDPVRKVA